MPGDGAVARTSAGIRSALGARLAPWSDRLSPWRPRHVARCANWYARDRIGRRGYERLSESDIRASRRSGTVFVFGSGKSLLDIAPEEWKRIAAHDTVGFSQFQEQRFVRVDYHLVGEAHDVDNYARLFRENPLYASTVYVVQEGWLAHVGNELIGRQLLLARSRVFRFHRRARGRYEPPSESFRHGLVHGFNSSISTTNFAMLVGWKRIVLTGVDLYDTEHFWVPWGQTVAGEKPGRTPDMRFPAADRIVEYFRAWRPLLEARGIDLQVHNPRSLLAGVLDVFSWEPE